MTSFISSKFMLVTGGSLLFDTILADGEVHPEEAGLSLIIPLSQHFINFAKITL